MHYFLDTTLTNNDTHTTYWLSEEESHHAKVLRLEANTAIKILNGNGLVIDAQLHEWDTKKKKVSVLLQHSTQSPALPDITIGLATIKTSERMEWLVEKITELGIRKIQLLQTERTERNFIRLEKLQKVAAAALKQSGNAWLPIISPSIDFSKLEIPATTSKLIGHCEDIAIPKTWIKTLAPAVSYYILIGPEGDFSPKEIKYAMEQGFEAIHLSHQRLRTETAAITAAIQLLDKFI